MNTIEKENAMADTPAETLAAYIQLRIYKFEDMVVMFDRSRSEAVASSKQPPWPGFIGYMGRRATAARKELAKWEQWREVVTQGDMTPGRVLRPSAEVVSDA